MSIAQQAISDLRKGGFSKIIALTKKINEKYTPIYKEVANKPIAQDELQQLLAYELASTDINEDDLTKLHLIERLAHHGAICSHLSGEEKAGLGFMLSAFCSAISAQEVANYKDFLPAEVNSKNIIDFLGDTSQFSQLLSNKDCKNRIFNLSDFVCGNSDAKSIQALINATKSNQNNSSFIDGLIYEKKEATASKKINQLKTICNQYIQHLEKIIKNHIESNDIGLFRSIFQDKVIETIKDFDDNEIYRNPQLSIEESLKKGNEELDNLMNNDSNFKLAVNKYRAVSDMLSNLENKEKDNLGSFKETFNKNKQLLHTRRDSAGMTFLKGVATVLSLGSILLVNNFWKPESKKKSQEIQSVLTAKL